MILINIPGTESSNCDMACRGRSFIHTDYDRYGHTLYARAETANLPLHRFYDIVTSSNFVFYYACIPPHKLSQKVPKDILP